MKRPFIKQLPVRHPPLKTLLLSAAFALGSAALTSAQAAPFAFAALGDMPYNIPAEYAPFERLIGTINSMNPAFSIHVGDVKGGSVPCTDENLQKVRDEFDLFNQPLVFTPGDNDWTDCHREKAGKFDPLERLAKVRQMYFTANRSLGAKPMTLLSQPGLIENSRWTMEGVVFTTIHVIGSNNGMERTPASVGEYFTRNAANMEWIKAAFAEARTSNAPAVVVAFQADPWWGTALVPTDLGLRDTLNALAAESKAFGKPVLLIHGDSHVLLIDHPLTEAGAVLTPGQTGALLRKVTRLQVMGADDIGAVMVMVDPADPAVFSFRPVYSKPN